jgi:hypothetical protein
MGAFDYKPSYRRNLPHVQPAGATFFLTCRLAGSLPISLIEQWNCERKWLAHLKQTNPAHHAQVESEHIEGTQYYSLASIMQSLKGYTALKANRLLGREGEFWAHESYDHYVRDADEWRRIVAYVLNNPVKAKYVNEWREWKWNYRRE